MQGVLVNWIISLVTGAVGGNVAGAIFKKLSLGTLGNTIAGLIGGGVGGQLLGTILGASAPTGIGGNIAGSGVGGLVVMAVVGVIKNAMAGSGKP